MRTSSVGLDTIKTLLKLLQPLKLSLSNRLVLSTVLFAAMGSAQAAEADTLTVAQLLEYQNIAWIIWGGVLVFFMQAGFALLESGSVRAKNAVNVMMKNYTDMCNISLRI